MNQSDTCIASKCVPCHGKEPALTRSQFAPLLEEVPNWTRDVNATSIQLNVSCRNFRHAMDILNKVAVIAERENHHPDIRLEKYRALTFILTTHASRGLTMNDFVMAKFIDQAVAETL